ETYLLVLFLYTDSSPTVLYTLSLHDALPIYAWHGINTTYWKDYEDGYARLNAVLEKITSTTLDSSVLSQMRNLIGNLEKKGICHILVNDGVIESWVNIDE